MADMELIFGDLENRFVALPIPLTVSPQSQIRSHT
jgi:hypothetical protein